jgi:hypothetical protein
MPSRLYVIDRQGIVAYKSLCAPPLAPTTRWGYHSSHIAHSSDKTTERTSQTPPHVRVNMGSERCPHCGTPLSDSAGRSPERCPVCGDLNYVVTLRSAEPAVQDSPGIVPPAPAAKSEPWVIRYDRRKIRASMVAAVVLLLAGGLLVLLPGAILGTLAQAPNFHSWIGFIGLFFFKTPLGLISLGLLGTGVCMFCRGAYLLMLMDSGPKLILDEVGVTEYFSSSAGRVIRWIDVASIESLQQVPTGRRGRRNWRTFSGIELTLRSESGAPKRVHFDVAWLEHSPSTILRAMRERSAILIGRRNGRSCKLVTISAYEYDQSIARVLRGRVADSCTRRDRHERGSTARRLAPSAGSGHTLRDGNKRQVGGNSLSIHREWICLQTDQLD